VCIAAFKRTQLFVGISDNFNVLLQRQAKHPVSHRTWAQHGRTIMTRGILGYAPQQYVADPKQYSGVRGVVPQPTLVSDPLAYSGVRLEGGTFTVTGRDEFSYSGVSTRVIGRDEFVELSRNEFER
jgi:hypothetical protein